MTMKIFFLLLLTCFLKIQQISSIHEDFYWREYTGTIPRDALVAFTLNSGRTKVYIGQAYLKGAGLIVVPIFPGVSSVKATYYNNEFPHYINKFIKILCTPHPENFEWISVNADNLLNQMASKRPIIAGHEKMGILYAGRDFAGGNWKLGKVTVYDDRPKQKKLYFINNSGKEQGSSFYEVLVYKNNAADVKLKAY